MIVYIPVSVGEIFDKLTILEIKEKKVSEPNKKKKIINEKKMIENIIEDNKIIRDNLFYKLKKINSILWEIENYIRKCDYNNDFGAKFISLAKKIYFYNDKRACIKNKISIRYNSEIIEIKDYYNYVKDK